MKYVLREDEELYLVNNRALWVSVVSNYLLSFVFVISGGSLDIRAYALIMFVMTLYMNKQCENCLISSYKEKLYASSLTGAVLFVSIGCNYMYSLCNSFVWYVAPLVSYILCDILLDKGRKVLEIKDGASDIKIVSSDGVVDTVNQMQGKLFIGKNIAIGSVDGNRIYDRDAHRVEISNTAGEKWTVRYENGFGWKCDKD